LRTWLVDAESKGSICRVRPEEEHRVKMVSNLVLPMKANGDFRAAFDGTSLDRHTVDEANIIPDVESIWRSLKPDQRVFITADLKDGFWHLAVDEHTSWYLVFYGLSSTELWRWRVTPFGLKQVPAWFRRWVAHILEGQGVHHYFDDLHDGAEPRPGVAEELARAVRQKEPAATLARLDREATISAWDEMLDVVLPKLMSITRKNKAHPNFVKIWIGNRVPCLGSERTRVGLQPHHETMELLERLDLVRSREEMRCLLGLVRYVTPSVPMLAAPLAEWNALTSTKHEFRWNPNAQQLIITSRAR